MASLRPSRVLADLKRRGCALTDLKKKAEQHRLRMELLVDRERAGLVTDLR